jgi:hypothetical protein
MWKATIAARFCDVDVEIRGASPKELRDWLWDYEARPLAEQERQSLSSLARTGRVGLTGAQLFKTDAFLEAQPFGKCARGVRARWKDRHLRIEPHYAGGGPAGRGEVPALRPRRLGSFQDRQLSGCQPGLCPGFANRQRNDAMCHKPTFPSVPSCVLFVAVSPR